MKSPIYWHPFIYNALMRILYRENFGNRYAELAEFIPEGSDVLEVCCGDCFLYEKHLKMKNVRYRGIDINRSFWSFYKKSGIDVQISDAFFDEIPEADFIIVQGSLYQFDPFCTEFLNKLLLRARKKVIVCEPVKNLSQSSNKIISFAASLASSVGNGAIPFRFNEKTFDEFIYQKYSNLISERCLVAGGHEKMVSLDAENFNEEQDLSCAIVSRKKAISQVKTAGIYNSWYHFAFILGWIGFIVFFVQKLQMDWWFEDDPGIYRIATLAASPLSFFIDKHWFILNNPNELIPFLFSSFWIDNFIAPRSATFAYYHNIFSFACASIVFYVLLKKLFRNSLHALGVCLAWTTLRSTLVINEYLSTRCYMEGFVFSCLAILATQHLILIDKKRYRFAFAWLVSIFSILAMLSKEFFPPVLLPIEFAIFAWFGAYIWTLLPIGLGVFYLTYRTWALGWKISYGMPFLEPAQYLLFLKRLPVYLFGSSFGYVYLLLLAFTLFHVILFQRKKSPLPLFILVLIFLSIATIFPISFAILNTWNEVGTWLRSGFVIRSLILVLSSSMIISLSRRRTQVLYFFLYLIWNISASLSTTRKWDEMKLKYQVIGNFITTHPGKNPVLADLPASWFLPELYNLYPEVLRRPFFSNSTDQMTQGDLSKLRNYQTMWVYQNGHMVKDDELFKKLTTSPEKGP